MLVAATVNATVVQLAAQLDKLKVEKSVSKKVAR
jgi:hypothetical protein